MRKFSEIYAQAAERKGGEATLEALVAEHRPRSRAELAAAPDDRWLSQMTRCVFQAGFNWKVIDNKWPGFEAAFHGFEPRINAAMSDDEFDDRLKDTRIVRNARKILSVRHNAQFLVDLAARTWERRPVLRRLAGRGLRRTARGDEETRRPVVG